jgi:hypothetical protein
MTPRQAGPVYRAPSARARGAVMTGRTVSEARHHVTASARRPASLIVNRTTVTDRPPARVVRGWMSANPSRTPTSQHLDGLVEVLHARKHVQKDVQRCRRRCSEAECPAAAPFGPIYAANRREIGIPGSLGRSASRLRLSSGQQTDSVP